MHSPDLSLILCTRNDSYMGNARWRLETVLNLTVKNMIATGHAQCCEIVVCDWGSEIPLHQVLNLSPVAKEVVRFIHVPPALASERQMDSAFPEVLALNAAVRRSRGTFVGRIDNDTIVGEHFFDAFFSSVIAGKLEFDPSHAFMFVHRRAIPFDFAAKSPSAEAVSKLINRFAPLLPIERIQPPNWFFQSPVGIALMHRDQWQSCGGYDEKLLYWGWMECDLAFRMMQKHSAIDLGAHIGRNFFHLEHYNPRAPRRSPRKCNPSRRDNVYHPNAQSWGLMDVTLHATSAPRQATEEISRPSSSRFRMFWELRSALTALPMLNVRAAGQIFPMSLIRYERNTGHLRRYLRPRKSPVAPAVGSPTKTSPPQKIAA